MEGIINTNMIVLARESRGLNQGDLAGKIGMSATNLSKIERSDIGIDEEILEKISEITNYPVSFFYQPGSMLSENLIYRKRLKVPQKLITPIYAQANVIRKHAQFITRTLKIKLPELPLYEVTERNTPAKLAAKLRQQWNITSPIINNLSRIVEQHGIIIATFPFGTERVDSKTILTDDKLPVICLNASMPGDRQRFSLAFELGQLLMHTFSKVKPDTDIVHEANLFAAELLMPAKDILPDLKDGVTLPILAGLKRKWKVSMISLLYRADDLGLLTPNQKKYLIQQFNQSRIRRREPVELDIPFEQPKLLKQYIAQFKTKMKLSTAEMAAVLHLYVDEFLDLYG